MFPRRSIHESQDDDRELTTYSTSDVKGHQAADKDRLGKLFKFRWTLQVVVSVEWESLVIPRQLTL